MKQHYTFKIHGTRGSLPVNGRRFTRYGGNTTSFSYSTPEGLIIFDAGTGITKAARRQANARCLPVTILFTHFHLDHVIGLPVFKPFYNPAAHITLMANAQHYPDWRCDLQRIAGYPFWPLEMKKFGARIRFRDLPRNGKTTIYGIRVSWLAVRHTQPCLAYRLETPKHSIVIATDHESGAPSADARFVRFCRQADVLIFDAQYTPREYARHKGWGHGTWKQGVHLAQLAGVQRLLLTHHDPTRSDRQIMALERAARKIFPNTRAAYDGMTV